MDPDPIEFSYQLGGSDFLDMGIATSGKWKNLQVGGGMLSVALGIIILVANLDSFWGTYLLLFGVLLIVLASRPISTWVLRRQAHGVLGTRADVVIDADGIRLTSSGALSKLPWASITKAKTNGRAVVLLHKGARYGWFTVRELDEPTRQRVLELLRNHVALEVVRDWFPFI